MLTNSVSLRKFYEQLLIKVNLMNKKSRAEFPVRDFFTPSLCKHFFPYILQRYALCWG